MAVAFQLGNKAAKLNITVGDDVSTPVSMKPPFSHCKLYLKKVAT